MAVFIDDRCLRANADHPGKQVEQHDRSFPADRDAGAVPRIRTARRHGRPFSGHLLTALGYFDYLAATVMPWSEAERAQLRFETLLRYVVVHVGADGGALFRPRDAAPLLMMARTELWPASAFETVERIWHYSRAALLDGKPQRLGALAVLPLFESGSPVLQALLGLTNLADEYSPPEDHRQLFARLVAHARAPLPPDLTKRPPANGAVAADPFTVGVRLSIEDVLRQQIEDALALCRGNVALAARRLGTPYRTLWDRIRRLEINVRAFRVSPV